MRKNPSPSVMTNVGNSAVPLLLQFHTPPLQPPVKFVQAIFCCLNIRCQQRTSVTSLLLFQQFRHVEVVPVDQSVEADFDMLSDCGNLLFSLHRNLSQERLESILNHSVFHPSKIRQAGVVRRRTLLLSWNQVQEQGRLAHCHCAGHFRLNNEQSPMQDIPTPIPNGSRKNVQTPRLLCIDIKK